MNTAIHFINNKKENNNKRHCSIKKSLTKSLKEVKLIKQGKSKVKTWDALYNELKESKER